METSPCLTTYSGSSLGGILDRPFQVSRSYSRAHSKRAEERQTTRSATSASETIEELARLTPSAHQVNNVILNQILPRQQPTISVLNQITQARTHQLLPREGKEEGDTGSSMEAVKNTDGMLPHVLEYHFSLVGASLPSYKSPKGRRPSCDSRTSQLKPPTREYGRIDANC